MNQLQLLTLEEFTEKTKALEGGHWTPHSVQDRWDYYSRVVELVRGLPIQQASNVLEMGTMGIMCVPGGHSIDYEERWDFPGKKPTIVHDARHTPWPVGTKQYDLFIALRVFQHLVPTQRECVQEALRIAKRVILVVPNFYDNPVIAGSKGITYSDLVSFCDGVHPNLYVQTKMGDLYYYDTAQPSTLNIEAVMAQAVVPVAKTTPLPSSPTLLAKLKHKLVSAVKG